MKEHDPKELKIKNKNKKNPSVAIKNYSKKTKKIKNKK
jgi:hypothetical protein